MEIQALTAQQIDQARARNTIEYRWSLPGVNMIGALLLGLFCGIVARILVPGDVFRAMSGPLSWLISLVLGLVGALVGYLIFTLGFGIGDTSIFDWGGVLSALIGTVIVLLIATMALRLTSSRPG
jgi:uncharacterized membrane protein YeaQ/YmgE (transglycosylase-associated protein family)